MLTHVIGYVSRINDKDLERLDKEGKKANYQATRDIGKLGIERYYEDLLHGTAGYQEVEVNSRGRVIRTLKYVPPIPGKDIVLNLDIELQLYAYKLLEVAAARLSLSILKIMACSPWHRAQVTTLMHSCMVFQVKPTAIYSMTNVVH